MIKNKADRLQNIYRWFHGRTGKCLEESSNDPCYYVDLIHYSTAYLDKV